VLTPIILLHIHEAIQTFQPLQPLVFAYFAFSTTFDVALRFCPALVVASIVSTAYERAISSALSSSMSWISFSVANTSFVVCDSLVNRGLVMHQ
jgi:hypothetical protein